MNSLLMDSMIKNADDYDYIKIIFGNKDLTIQKRFLDYQFHNAGYKVFLELYDKSRNELYLFKVSSIDVVTIIKPKFKPINWFDSGRKKGVETQ